MTENTETGAEAGGESYVEQLAAEQSAAEASETDQEESEQQEPAEPPKKQADTKEPGEGEKEPLSVEEYQKRHENVNAALRQERAEKRAFKSELEQIRAELAEMRQQQPQQFQQFTLDQRIAEYEAINWQLWQQQNPEAAQAGWNDYQGLLSNREAAQRRAEQDQQARQQQAQQAQAQQFMAAVEQSEVAARAAKPDYDAAVDYLREALEREGQAQGYFGEQAAAYAQNQIVQIGFRVFQSGQDLANFAYEQALQRGYKPPVADIASVKAGAEAAKSISTLGTKTGAESGASFEETMSGLSGAAAKSFWEKAKAQQYG